MQKAALGDACHHLSTKACEQRHQAQTDHTLELESKLPATFSASTLHKSSALGGQTGFTSRLASNMHPWPASPFKQDIP